MISYVAQSAVRDSVLMPVGASSEARRRFLMGSIPGTDPGTYPGPSPDPAPDPDPVLPPGPGGPGPDPGFPDSPMPEPLTV